MSAITVFQENDPSAVLFHSMDGDEISRVLGEVGIRFERWMIDCPITPEMTHEEVLQAYDQEINKLVSEEGYQTVDIAAITPDNPQKDEFRQKFLQEHTHSEDEVRFFVAGEGMFYLHIEDKVYMIHCCKDDLLSVPDQTKHWFDMGPEPHFTAIRFFNNPQGWVADFTGDDIAKRFPLFDE